MGVAPDSEHERSLFGWMRGRAEVVSCERLRPGAIELRLIPGGASAHGRSMAALRDHSRSSVRGRSGRPRRRFALVHAPPRPRALPGGRWTAGARAGARRLAPRRHAHPPGRGLAGLGFGPRRLRSGARSPPSISQRLIESSEPSAWPGVIGPRPTAEPSASEGASSTPSCWPPPRPARCTRSSRPARSRDRRYRSSGAPPARWAEGRLTIDALDVGAVGVALAHRPRHRPPRSSPGCSGWGTSSSSGPPIAPDARCRRARISRPATPGSCGRAARPRRSPCGSCGRAIASSSTPASASRPTGWSWRARRRSTRSRSPASRSRDRGRRARRVSAATVVVDGPDRDRGATRGRRHHGGRASSGCSRRRAASR